MDEQYRRGSRAGNRRAFDHDDGDACARQQEASIIPAGPPPAMQHVVLKEVMALSVLTDKNRPIRFRVSGAYACLSGVVTTSPSRSSVTLIWHDSREFGRTS